MDTNLNKVIKKRYEIKERISIGGMSTVYLASDLVKKRKVVLKILYKHIFNSHKTRQIFLNEIKITSQLKHKNIVALYDYFLFDGFWCLVFEYIEGVTLRKLLNQKRTLSEKGAINIVLQVLEGLSLAQKHKIVHRDIKPENILIVGEKKVKILDFGISVDQHFGGDTFKTEVIGSLKYIAPEIVAGIGTKIQSDFYSLGIVLFEMLIGSPPFNSKNPGILVQKHLYQSMPRITDYQFKISQQMENVIIKATAKNIQERYQNPDQMVVDLQKCFDTHFDKEQPLFLTHSTYQGKVKNLLFTPQSGKDKHFFWLQKKFLFTVVFLQLGMFLAVLFKLIVDSW